MKKKYYTLVICLMAFTQSLLAGGGGQPKRPGSLTGMLGAFPYIIGKSSEWLDSDRYENDDDDTDIEREEEDLKVLGASTPIYLIGEKRGNEIDFQFEVLLTKLALEGKIILVHNNTIIRMHDCNPVIMPDAPDLETDASLPLLIQSCCTAQNLLLTQGSDDPLLYTLTELVLAIMNPSTTALKEAIDRLHQNQNLVGNFVYNWIVKNTDTIIEKDPKGRTSAVEKTWKKTIHNRSAKSVNSLQQILEALLQSLLDTDPSILNGLRGSFQLDFQSLDTWNDLIIAQNLHHLHALPESTPIVFLGDITAIRRNTIQRLLESSGIPTSQNLENLPIDERLKAAKQARIDAGDFETAIDAPLPSTRPPVYLIGEEHYNRNDIAFRELIEASEKIGLVIYGRESPPMMQSDTPEVSQVHYLEDELAKALCSFNIAAAALGGLLENQIQADAALNNILPALATIASTSDQLLLKAIEQLYNHAPLKTSYILPLIDKLKKDLVKTNTFEKRAQTFKKAFQPHINDETLAKEFIYIFRFMKRAIIEAQKERPKHKQLTERQIEWQENDLGNVDIPIMSPWRDIFIAENIEPLYLKSLREDLPLVVILGSSHIDNIQRILESRGIPVSSNVMELPLEMGSETNQAKRIKKAKQSRLDNEIPKETEESLRLREMAIARQNDEETDAFLDKLFGD